MRQRATFFANLALLLLIFLSLDATIRQFWPHKVAEVQLPDASFPEISNREEFFDACGTTQPDQQRFDACKVKLPILSTSFLWVDRKYLLKEGELLTSKHLDIFYGLSGDSAESARMTIGSALVARCRKGKAIPAQSFEQLIDPECLQRIPTLAELGLEMDPEWAGIQLVDQTYDGTMKPLPPMEP